MLGVTHSHIMSRKEMGYISPSRTQMLNDYAHMIFNQIIVTNIASNNLNIIPDQWHPNLFQVPVCSGQTAPQQVQARKVDQKGQRYAPSART